MQVAVSPQPALERDPIETTESMTHPDISKSIESVDFDFILTANATRVFSERDASLRRAALEDLWAPQGLLVEDGHVLQGLDAISESIGSLLNQLPPGTRFVPSGPAAGHHGVGRLRWRAVDAAGQPSPVSGTDIALIEAGKISHLYVILDPGDR